MVLGLDILGLDVLHILGQWLKQIYGLRILSKFCFKLGILLSHVLEILFVLKQSLKEIHSFACLIRDIHLTG